MRVETRLEFMETPGIMETPPRPHLMRIAAVILLQALIFVSGSYAQQDPPKTPPPDPAAPAKPAAEKAGTPASAVDPLKMAAAPGEGGKPPQSTVDDKAYVLGPEDNVS